jgi:hypothetical protein
LEMLRLPPRIKILEALGAIADNRVKIVSDREAIVVSSEGDRSYKVYIDLEEKAAYSDDNGTKFRGYVGYPIVAVLMIKGVLPFDSKIAEALKGVKWRQLNEKYKSYAIVEDLLLRELKTRSIDPEYVKNYVSSTMSALARLGLRRKT